MSKSIYEVALDNLTWLLHDEFDENPKRSRLNVSQRLDMFKKVKDTLKQAQNQEKLFELYKELITAKDYMINKLIFADSDYYAMEKTEKDLEQRIKELENGN